jgi:predicted metal-binding membrane protein
MTSTTSSKSGEYPDQRESVLFISGCGVAFLVSVAATAYFCHSMCCEMEMPGGWTTSMMWTRMPGQTWIESAVNFQLMWLAMMMAMMLPSALLTFLKTKRPPVSLSVMATGYFAVWVALGVGIYALGVAFAAAVMRWEGFSRAVPVLSGAALIAAGVFQFTRWKTIGLLHCRSSFGCSSVCPERETDLRLGCKQGAACCLCCAAPTMILIVLGMMNPVVIIGVTVIIAAEKVLPRAVVVARFVGVLAIVAGATSLCVVLLRPTSAL